MGSNGKHWGVMKRTEERKERKKGKWNKERRAGAGKEGESEYSCHTPTVEVLKADW